MSKTFSKKRILSTILFAGLFAFGVSAFAQWVDMPTTGGGTQQPPTVITDGSLQQRKAGILQLGPNPLPYDTYWLDVFGTIRTRSLLVYDALTLVSGNMYVKYPDQPGQASWLEVDGYMLSDSLQHGEDIRFLCALPMTGQLVPCPDSLLGLPNIATAPPINPIPPNQPEWTSIGIATAAGSYGQSCEDWLDSIGVTYNLLRTSEVTPDLIQAPYHNNDCIYQQRFTTGAPGSCWGILPKRTADPDKRPVGSAGVVDLFPNRSECATAPVGTTYTIQIQ